MMSCKNFYSTNFVYHSDVSYFNVFANPMLASVQKCQFIYYLVIDIKEVLGMLQKECRTHVQIIMDMKKRVPDTCPVSETLAAPELAIGMQVKTLDKKLCREKI